MQIELDGLTLVEKSIERLQAHEPSEGYWLAFSGGKDSIVVKRLCDMAGVKYTAYYNVTTIDPPELIYYIREHHKDVVWLRPEKPFLVRMAEKMPPLRQVRWCCAEYKEAHGQGIVVMGIRNSESTQRGNRRLYEVCFRDTKKHFLNPIIDWSDADVWSFIQEQELPYCCLYDEGWERIGCLFCPNAKPRERQMQRERYPAFEKTFRIAFRKLYANRKAKDAPSVNRWQSGDEMFDWWINER